MAPVWVNLTALPTRFTSTWRTRAASRRRAAGSCGSISTRSDSPLFAARWLNIAATSPSSPRRSTGPGLIRSAPASPRARSSRSSIWCAQGLARGADGPDPAALALAVGQVLQQGGEAQDQVQGGAQLVTDAGQEGPLGPIGLLGGLLGLDQRHLGPAPPRHLAGQADRPPADQRREQGRARQHPPQEPQVGLVAVTDGDPVVVDGIAVVARDRVQALLQQRRQHRLIALRRHPQAIDERASPRAP